MARRNREEVYGPPKPVRLKVRDFFKGVGGKIAESSKVYRKKRGGIGPTVRGPLRPKVSADANAYITDPD